jgi:uncharacterized membrane-anchored protein
MKKKKILFFAFALAIIIVPIYVIMSSQDILTNGTYYKFRPQAYDPIDPVRGHYLQINYNRDNIPTDDDIKSHDDVYVSIGVDDEGFAYFKKVFKNKPKKGDYLAVKAMYVSGMEEIRQGVFSRQSNAIVEDDRGNYKKTVTIEVPDNMSRFYINEDYGLAGEKAFLKERESAYIGIRIKGGLARIQDIYLKGTPIMEYLKKN